MPTMDWTLCASGIQICEDGFIDLKQFRMGQVIKHVEGDQSWMIVDVREKWLKVLPLFKRYEGDPCKHKRFNRMSVDLAFEQGWWKIGQKIGGTSFD